MAAIKLCGSMLLLLPALLPGQGMSTSTVLTSSLNPAILGQKVILTAKVMPAGASGAVTFYDGVTVLDTLPLSGGQASFTTTLLGPGMHSLRASYPGDHVTWAPSSAQTAQTVVGLPANGFIVSDTLMPSQYPGLGPSAVGDFNADGNPDLALTYPGSVAVFLGQGDGAFQSSGFVFSNGATSILCPGDFNGDGKTDLAVAEPGGITVLSGRGDGTFLPGATVALTGTVLNILNVIPADFNGDGVADLAVGVQGAVSGIQILLGNGDGTFQAPLIYPGASYQGPEYAFWTFFVGDLNGDDRPDVGFVSGSGLSNTLTILLNNGNGFQAPLDYPFSSNSLLALGDLNSDGKLDLVAVDDNYTLNVFLGNGKGAFQQTATSYSGLVARQGVLAVADMNGDGLPDVVWASNYQAQVLLGNGDGTLQNPVATSFPAQSGEPTNIVFADFNRDGRNDFATQDSVLLGVPSGVITGSSTSLVSSQNPVASSDDITLTAVVSPLTATGTVTFYDTSDSDRTPYSTGRAIGTSTLSGGKASLLVRSPAAGTHFLQAAYNGDAADAQSVSPILTEKVLAELTPGAPVPNPLTPNVLVNPGAENGLTGWWPSYPTSTVVAQNPPPPGGGSYSFLGKQVPDAFITQTVQLTPVAGITLAQVDSGNLAANYSFWFADLSPGSGALGGITLTFLDVNGVFLGQGISSLLQNTGTLTWSNGTGSFPIPPGTRTINYTMDFLASSVNTGLIDNNLLTISSISAALAVTTLSSSANPAASVDSITLTATVSPASATGAVTFLDGPVTLGTIPLVGGKASLTLQSLNAGTHTLLAIYGGDASHNSSYSSYLNEVILATLAPGPPVANPLTPNLLVNPGAENGLTGWWPSYPASAVVTQSPPPGGGSYSFLGKQVPAAFITQTVLLTQVTGITLAQVDSGSLAANYSFWFADPSPGSGSYGEITLTFLDANGAFLGQGVSNRLQNNQTFAWLNGTGSFPIPSGTRTINYTMDFLTTMSADTGLIDDNLLTIGRSDLIGWTHKGSVR